MTIEDYFTIPIKEGFKKKPSWGKSIKCPQCGSIGHSTERDKRLYFDCPVCQLSKLLKEINNK